MKPCDRHPEAITDTDLFKMYADKFQSDELRREERGGMVVTYCVFATIAVVLVLLFWAGMK